MSSSYILKHLLEVAPVVATWSLFMWLWLSKCPRAFQGSVAGVLFSLGFIAGWLGFLKQTTCADAQALSWSQCATNAVHSTLQLIVLNVEAKNTQGFLLSFARVALPLATAQVLVPKQWLLRLSLVSSGVAVLVLGSARTGLSLAKYYGASSKPSLPWWERRSIMGVDDHLDQPDVLAFEEHFPVLKAPLHDPQELTRLGLRRREHIVVCTGDDIEDIELTRRISKLLPADPLKGPKITVSIESAVVPRACWLDPELSQRYLKGQLRFFHAQHSIARVLLLSHAPHILHIDERRFVLGGNRQCHIVVCGDGPLVEELIAQSVRALVYSPDKPLKVTVFVPSAPERQRAFFARFPALASNAKMTDEIFGTQLPLAEIAFVESSAEQINASALRDAGHIDAIYAVGREDGEARVVAAEALKVVTTLSDPKRPPVVVCVDQAEPVVGPFAQLPPAVRLEIFSATAWVDGRHNLQAAQGSMTSLPDELADDIAMRLWWVYEPKPEGMEEFKEQIVRPRWLQTSHHDHAWNRYAADHAIVKLELLGLDQAATRLEVKDLVEAESDWLSKLEHRRYVCERMVDGWLRNPYAQRDGEDDVSKANRKKGKHLLLNYTLRPFGELPESERKKDEDIVNQIVDALDALRALRESFRR